MSTVLPPAAALPVALPLLLLLPLLLQPKAAKAIAAKAAIADVRLIMFLSVFELVPLSRSAPAGPVRAHRPRDSREGGRFGGGPLRRPHPPWESIPAGALGRTNVTAGTSAGDFPP